MGANIFPMCNISLRIYNPMQIASKGLSKKYMLWPIFFLQHKSIGVPINHKNNMGYLQIIRCTHSYTIHLFSEPLWQTKVHVEHQSLCNTIREYWATEIGMPLELNPLLWLSPLWLSRGCRWWRRFCPKAVI